jgi:uncharacterized membrane-anchored protein YitT (DUF2179 family)
LRLRDLKDAALLLIGAFIYAAGTACFVTPANIAPGGATGIAIMINFLTGWPVGAVTMLINIPLLFLAWKYLSRKFAIRTAVACFICSFILDYLVTPNLPIYGGNRLFGSLYGGILVGVGMALIFIAGCSTGGSDIASYLMQKKRPDISIGRSLLILDGIILFISIFAFNDVDAGLFGMASLYAQTKVIDAILYGYDAGTQVSIITKQPKRISKRIIEEMDRSATIVDGKGAYSEDDLSIVVCVVRRSEFSSLRRIIQENDEKAFVIVTEVTEVLGLGFKGFAELN